MAATMFDEGLVQIQKYIFGVDSPNLYIALFENPTSLNTTQTFGSFMLSSLSGATPLPLSPSTWVNISTPGLAEFTYSGLSWLLAAYAGGTTLYGYVVYDNTLNVALWAELFPVPYLVPSIGGAVVLALDKKGQAC